MEKKMPLYEVDKTWWKEVLENEDMLLFSEMSQRCIEHVVVLTSHLYNVLWFRIPMVGDINQI